MFKYLVVLALALVAVMAAPPAPGAPLPAGAPKDLQTANQLLYSYGYPSVYSGYPYAYSAGYAYPSYYGGVYYG